VGGEVGAGDESRQLRALAWIHGFGRPCAHATEIEDLLEKLAQEELFDVEGAASTSEAESVVGWAPSIYWYVGTTNRSHGALAVGEWNPNLASSAEVSIAGVCPFDTGGLLVEPPKYECGVAQRPERVQYVGRHVHALHDWHPRIRTALWESHDRFADYVDGGPPSIAPTENVHTHFDGSTDDGRPWSWEGRVAKSEYALEFPTPDRIYWHDEADRLAVLAEARRILTTGPSPSVLAAVQIIADASRVSAGGDAHEDVRDELKFRAVST